MIRRTTRSARFAAAITDRREARTRRWPAVPRVLRQQRRQFHQHRTYVAILPHVHVKFANARPLALTTGRASSVRLMARVPATHSAATLAARRASLELVERVVRHSRRIETVWRAVGRSPTARETRPQPGPFTPPLPTVVRRSSGPALQPEAVVAQRADRGPSASAPPPPVDVTRVTEHVLRTLDRRLGAFRERHGRS